MTKVILTFEDTPEGLVFTEDFDVQESEIETSAAAVLGIVVVKLVEELIGPSLEESVG